jgi:hypothetical protein
VCQLSCIEASTYLVIWSAPYSWGVVQTGSSFQAVLLMLLLLRGLFAAHRQLLLSFD